MQRVEHRKVRGMLRLNGAVVALMVCGGMTVPAGAAQSAMVVTFEHPESFTDAATSGNRRASRTTLSAIDEHLQLLGQRYLRPGQALTVTILDVDLAGDYEPWRATQADTRIMRTVTWPRIKVRYSLEEGGAVRVAGEETVSDLNYLMRAKPGFPSDALRFERAMLDDWFQARFGAQSPLS